MPQTEGENEAKAIQALEAKLSGMDRIIQELTKKNAEQDIALKALALFLTKGDRQGRSNLATQALDAAVGTDLGIAAQKLLGVDAL